MIEIGTSTHAIAGFGSPSKPFRQAIAEIADCGFSHVLLLTSEDGPPVNRTGFASKVLVDITRSDVEAILRTVSSYGLRVSCIYPGFVLDFSREGVGATIEKLMHYRDIAWRLGCHVMIIPAGKAKKPHMPHKDKRGDIKRVAEVMDALSSDTPGEFFKVAVDIHYGGIIETVADGEHLLQCTDNRNSGLCLNIGHMTTLKEDGWIILTRFPERIHVIAWKDHLVGDNLPSPVFSCELGKGNTPFRKYVEAYREVECTALNLITFEDVPFEEKRGALKKSYQYLTDLFRESFCGHRSI